MSRALLVLLIGCGGGSTSVDLDGDGAFSTRDCNDLNASVSPFLPEILGDGIDNDCDPSTPDVIVEDTEVPDDTGPDVIDLDGDGVPAEDDCDDQDPQVGLLQTFYPDCDGDGWAPAGAAGTTRCTTPPPTPCPWTLLEPVHPARSQANTTSDCVDDDPLVHPTQTGWFDVPQPAGTAPYQYDYDCDGQAAQRYPLFSCVTDLTVPEGCTVSGPQFDSPTPCGLDGSLHDGCVLTGPVCSPDIGYSWTQECR